ncbi:MAG: hypothetical protein AAGA48_37045 [Myxococcota bacterium]
MTAELNELRRRLEAWDPDQDDLPDDLARALDVHPDLRSAFDARFVATDLPREPVPDGLADRVMPRPSWRPIVRRWMPWALAALALFVVAASGFVQLLPEERRGAATVEAGARKPEALASVVPPNEPLPLFDPRLPPPPRRLPTRPTRYLQPPPGGPFQFEAVAAVRRRKCSEAMRFQQLGMSMTPDHATLYRGVWLCFNEAHQRKLEQARAMNWEEFAELLPHFEGDQRQAKLARNQNSSKQSLRESDLSWHRTEGPRWAKTPTEGLEYRLWRVVEDSKMVEVLTSLFGEATVADHLVKDLFFEVLAAEGLSRVSLKERNDRLIDAWARRVYVAEWALRQRPGRLIDAHRKEVMSELRQRLDAATTAPDGAEGWLPKRVRQARSAGRGETPIPPN